MSIDARNRILSRLRAGIGDSKPRTTADDCGDVARYDWSQEEKVRHFTDAMTAVKTEVHQTTASHWPALLQLLLREKQLKKLLVSPARETGQALQNVDEIDQVSIPENPRDLKDELFFDIDASLTTCRGAIAETGSLVLWPDHEEPRAMSLVPPVHFALLHASDIHNTLTDVMKAEGWAEGMPTNALLISGPSKTADIARILAYGAHGPRELIVLLIAD
ncbi:LutC/YkgG family protein [Endozoicomonadaceae bacterium StTr2]